MDNDLVQSSKQYVEGYFRDNPNSDLTYHNWKHCAHVLKSVELIASNTEGVSETEKEMLCLAAIFHDMGYIEASEEHELRSAALAEEYLKQFDYPQNQIATVQRIILATKMHHEPKDILEKIIIDADLSHLGREDYMETTYKDLSEEVRHTKNKNLSDEEWAVCCLSFLSKHRYLTQFARDTFRQIKKKNIERIKKMIPNQSDEQQEVVVETPNKEKKKKKKDDGNPLKGVETMFKTALRNHVDLSSIADKKANTLISVNAIIISIVLSALFPKLDSNPFMFYPSITILVSCLVTVFLAILSTIPNITRGVVGKESVKEGKGNLLFFGNFHKMKLEDYEWSINQLMNSKDYIYNSMTRDLYFLGKVLNKKYFLLRWSYYLFMFGLLLSIIVFIINVMPYIGTTTEVNLEDIGSAF